MLETAFPLGIQHYAIGGALIGLAVAGIFLMTGIVGGASTFFTSTISFFSDKPFFRQKKFLDSRQWRLFFAAGMVIGGAAFIFLLNDGSPAVTAVQWWRLVIGGFVIGIGTRMAGGCTSGHGICGMSSFYVPSFLAVLTFLLTAIATAFVVSSLGVAP